MYNIKNTVIVLVLCVGFAGCQGFFGKKTDKNFLDVPIYNDQTVAYVPIQPVLTGFDNPVDLLTGWDDLIYVVDSAQQKIFAFDEAGNPQGEITVRGVSSLAQDRNLDLLATGIKDTVVGGIPYQLPAIYRIPILNNQGQISLSEAHPHPVAIHPFCFNSAATPNASDPLVRFTSIGMMATGSYYIGKTGPGLAGTTQGDAIVLFNHEDKFVTPLVVSTQVGNFNNYFKRVKSITTFAQPPQSPAVNKKGDFYFTSWDASQVLKVQGIIYREDDNGSSYQVLELPQSPDSSKGEDVFMRPYRFSTPSDITIAGDATGYIFVTDAAKDSLYIFNGVGYEGVNAPPGSASSRAVRASFGGRGVGLMQFNNPSAVCYKNKIVYVADAGNKRVLRFQLTTDFK